MSPAGNRAAFATVLIDQDIQQVDLSGPGEPQPLISSTYVDNTPMFSPDGNKIAFSSSRSGYREIWVCDRDGSNPLQITDLKSVMSSVPFWSPDGTRIVFQSVADDQREIFVVRSSGGKVERITNHPEQDLQPSWSHDGEWIYFASDRSGERGIWKVAVRGGERLPVTGVMDDPASFAIESQDGETIYVYSGTQLWRMPIEGGPITPLLADVWGAMAFSPVMNGIYHLQREPPGLYFYDFRSKESEQLLEISGTPGAGLSASPDGQTILWVKPRPAEADIMLVDGFR